MKKLLKITLIGLGALVALGIIVSIVSPSDDTTDSQSSATPQPTATGPAEAPEATQLTQVEEVTITACEPDAFDTVNITGEAHNTSSKRSDYIIDISIESADGSQQYDSTLAFVTNVEPGQTATWETVSFPSNLPSSGWVCKVVDVERNASF